MGGKGALNHLLMLPKASIYVPKVMCKPVLGGNTVSVTLCPKGNAQIMGGKTSNTVSVTFMHILPSEVCEVLKSGPGSQIGA